MDTHTPTYTLPNTHTQRRIRPPEHVAPQEQKGNNPGTYCQMHALGARHLGSGGVSRPAARVKRKAWPEI